MVAFQKQNRLARLGQQAVSSSILDTRGNTNHAFAGHDHGQDDDEDR